MRRWIIIMAVLVLAACEPTVENEPLPTVMVLPTGTAAGATAVSADTTLTLPYYAPVSGELATGETDIWEFEAKQNDHIAVRAVSSAVVTQMTLLDFTGAVLAEGADVEAVIAADGLYTLRVAATQGEGTYQLGLSYVGQAAPAEPTFTPLPQIVGVPTPTPLFAGLGSFVGELRDGAIVPSDFPANTPPQVFTFTALAGQFAHIALDPVSGDGDLVMTLYDPNAVALAADSESDNGAGILRDIPLASGGTYSVRVESNGEPANFSLELNLRDAAVPVTPTYNITPTATSATPVLTPEYAEAAAGERLSPEQPVSAEISAQSILNTHSFSLRSGDIVTVAVSPSEDSALIPHVEIIDPDGEPVITLIGNLSPFDRDAIVSPLVAALDGPYTLFVTGEGETEGAYTVSFGYGSTRQNIFKGEAPPDRANLTGLERRATADIWHIELAQGDLISAGVTPLDGNIIPVLEIYTASGQLLGIDSESGGPRSPFVSGIQAPQTGVYLLKVRPANAEAIGAYQLVWRYLGLGATATPPAGTLPLLTVESVLAPEAYVFYPFQGKAGQRILIDVRAGEVSALDPVAAIIGIDGTVIAEGDDSAGGLNPYFEATLPEDGTYQLRLNGYLSSGGFRAEITAIYQ